MLDPRLLRTQLDDVARRLKRRGYELDVAAIQALENERKTLQAEVQRLQQTRNELAKKIGQAKAKGENASELMATAARLPETLRTEENKLADLQTKTDDILLGVPNLPHDSVPDGRDENANQEVRRWGEPPRFNFTPKDHVDIGAGLGMLDFDAAAKLTGAR